jgi:excisionase family DNA binding protein
MRVHPVGCALDQSPISQGSPFCYEQITSWPARVVTLSSKVKPDLELKALRVGHDELLTADELADFLRVHRSTVYRLLRNGQLPAFRVGSDWRFSRDLIEKWLHTRIRATPV